MLKTTKLTALAVLKGVTMAALLSGTLATNAAAEDAKIKSASFSIKPAYQYDEIVVTSSDGKKWDTIDAKALKLSATMKVDTKYPGYVDRVGILLGGCVNTGCAGNPVMFSASPSTRDYNFHKLLDFPGNKFPLSKNGIAVPGYGDEILNSCNAQLQAGGATKSYSFPKLITASFSANTRKGKPLKSEIDQPGQEGYLDFNGGDVTRQAQFKVKVICKAYTPPPMALNSITFEVTVVTDKKCPRKAMVMTEFTTSRAGKIEFNLYRNDGEYQKITVNAKEKNGKFRALWFKKYTFKKSVDRKYMIATLGHKYSSEWKPMVIKCGVQNDHGSTGDKADAPKPQTGKPNGRPLVIVTPKPPKRPAIKVAPVRKIACIGGKVSRNSCFCPSRTKRVKIGAAAYRCLVNVVRPNVPPRQVIKTAPVRRVAPIVQTAPVKRVATARNKRRFGKRR